MNNESTSTIKCRKCGGPHFTIKCGKEQIVETIKEEVEQNKPIREISLENLKENKYKQSYNKHERYHSKITYRVKLSELPKDMSEPEMMDLVSEWGHIIKVKVINYDENSVAYIDFGFEDEAKYFIEAIDKTPFDSILLNASRVDSY